jgi:tRNA(fMet)-specific endonuclease VapC
MQRSLLDTDTFSEVLRGRNQSIQNKADAYLMVFGNFALSVITITEVIDGFRRQQRDDRIANLLADIKQEKHEIILVQLETAVLAGHISGDLHRSGQAIGGADPLIAATAINEGIPLITGNLRHYERVQQIGYTLQIESWHERRS